MQVSKTENFIDSLKIRTSLDPGFRRDDDFEANRSSNATPAQSWMTILGPTASQTSSRRKPGSSVFRCAKTA
jgi:hypothetical protein